MKTGKTLKGKHMSKTIEALRIADELETMLKHGYSSASATQDAATELRQLHAANIDCIDHFNALKADYDNLHALNQRLAESNVELLEAMKGCLLFPGNRRENEKARAAIARAETTYKAEVETK